MKKQISILSFTFLLMAAVALTASTQQGKSNKENKEQQQNKGKDQDKKGNSDKASKGNSGKHNDEGQPGKMNDKSNKGNRDNKGKNDMHNNNDNDEMHANRGNDNKMYHGDNFNDYDHYGYNWNRDNFKDRKKFKNQDKVTICHKFNRGDEDAVTINVSANAAKAHMNHGDVMGSCPALTGNRRFSDIFLRNRTDYYNNLQNGQEQVYYSRSILDYALLRLASSRLQLNTMQNNNMPLADIQRKQGTVVELEQNVSLLETVLGVAANLVASKFQ